jgi:hypothetical protein
MHSTTASSWAPSRAEAIHTPTCSRSSASTRSNPLVRLVESVLPRLQSRGAARDDVEKHTIATICFGSYLAAFYRGESKVDIAEAAVSV